MKLYKITTKYKDIKHIKNLYYDSFPKNEQIPFWFLMFKSKKNNIEFLSIEHNKSFVGFLYLINYKDIVFVLYFAIDPNVRSKGYGSKILCLLDTKYANKRIVLNIESPYVKSINQEDRNKRKNFYLKNNFSQTKINILEYGEVYNLLIKNGKINIEEYHALMRSFIGKFLYIFFKPRIVIKQ